MVEEECSSPNKAAGFHIQFSLPGLIVFTITLVLASGILTFAFSRPSVKPSDYDFPAKVSETASQKSDSPVPFWGELITYDTLMERPEEYTALEIRQIQRPKWIFSEKSPRVVRQLMVSCGIPSEQIDQVLASQNISLTASGTTIMPDESVVFSLSPEVRARFYRELAKDEANHYMRFPFCFPGNSLDEIAAGGRIDSNTLATIRSLLYRNGETSFFSDFEVVMNHIPSEEQRKRLVKVLSAHSAVLVRIRIRPDTDVEKLLGYWAGAPGVRFTDLRPLVDSMKRLEDGATISLLYFLPQFARERLYTYPLPSQAGQPAMDCHWSTMNFFNDPPDNRFADPSYTVSYLTSHYYPVAKPTRYGDRIFLLDEKGNAIHSAVYIADDIVFTKNGNNYMEPWMLMRLKNLLALYSVLHSPSVVVYRNKDS